MSLAFCERCGTEFILNKAGQRFCAGRCRSPKPDIMLVEEMPRIGMQKLTIAFDVDGTLITNVGAKPDIANQRIVDLLKILATFKNVQVIVWSGGGKDYAARWARLLGVDDLIWKAASKTEHKELAVDIAIDDIQECALGKLNLIVREK